ncbi:unnamed protein product [Didymodactylos carnosus]|uniref:Uncharacterized protein n=1 Tax=Didymodactylos carnosus TaxID=1234261 RepID=A0A815KA14_9BILA|nr:unnamed protein product [Didymodactylos carnosus]CAF1387089.1 unnamed protein product [Didymodactylos carnosus]CAF3625245.1 unnamed protein product [Didymodactylos carnosus]CAF4281905.1 unnamed protein product [Didymodactylos carnosus]
MSDCTFIVYRQFLLIPSSRNTTTSTWMWNEGNEFDSSDATYSEHRTIDSWGIDSLTAYIVKSTTTPVPPVHSYRLLNPKPLVPTFRFQCLLVDAAQNVIQRILNTDYQIEIAFYFAGFSQVKANIGSTTNK